MLQTLLEKLKDGDHSIVDVFVQADARWGDIVEDIDAISVDELAGRLTTTQSDFEEVSGDQLLSRWIYGVTGFAHLYSSDDGFDENMDKACKLRGAFEKSLCSIEVKRFAKEAAKTYGVD